ncbi:ferritin-like domain-containing protein [Sphingomonas sp. BIUV-7]|uniref:Ferritin-like domain-containing protein n=1 Tax=Sphingomonas natans TaxID=3063330 RepID=A0ABT8Y812_9SPHN|nr:ferritin-like domain-containing protein [Sphingomonas sp. BIUV-7]MDO6413835.1 ferritin-like domain-containing protein [Sphingomonas sp. BIUV-7]
MIPPATLSAACRDVLLTADPRAKVMAARAAARGWHAGQLAHVFDVAMPARPARTGRPELLPPSHMPKRKKGGSLTNRIALLHAIAHIECVAIDLAVDLVGRFGGQFPRAFADDWMRVAAEEAMHFALIDRRLRALGAAYGDLPAHDGLWEAAEATAHDAGARLAVVPLVLEARGLDVTPQMIVRFDAVGDAVSSRILARILSDEIKHVATGMKWFESSARNAGREPAEQWRELVVRHFKGAIKAPFNDSARLAAGLTPEFYASLAAPEPKRQTPVVVAGGAFSRTDA